MSEFNPNHPVTRSLHDHWHKIVALIMQKHGIEHVVITERDLRELAERDVRNVVAHDKADGLHIYLVDEAEGMRLAALLGVGDAKAGEWRETNLAYHIRRRLTEAECKLAGDLVMRDIRGQEEENRRIRALLRDAPHLRMMFA